MRRTLIIAAGLLAFAPACAPARVPAGPVNAGALPADAALPFEVTRVASLDVPWKIAFLPDGRMLVTEKAGVLRMVTQAGVKSEVAGAPAVVPRGQGGFLTVAVAPSFARDHGLYFAYSEPGPDGTGSLVLAHATLAESGGAARLDGVRVIWRDPVKGLGQQYGSSIAFAPDGRSLFLAVGDRQRMVVAQDPDQPLGKILRLTLDGKPFPGNPMAGRTGATSVSLIAPPANTAAAQTATATKVALTAPNLTPAETWSSGHRNPYGLVFDTRGRLWDWEHGPKGGDELNLILPGRNYGWPLVSYGMNYDGVAIADPDTRPDLAKPALYWVPIVGPAGMSLYRGTLFPGWDGSFLLGGSSAKVVLRIAFDAQGNPHQADRWTLGFRVRDVVAGPDGAIWVIEDKKEGGLYKLTPKR